MNDILIRPATSDDIPGIVRLYDSTKGENELRWVLADPNEPGSLRSFVAVDQQGSVVGHIGYVKTTYCIDGKQVVSVYPIKWIVSPVTKGKGVGKRLLTSVLDLTDFSFHYGGTKVANPIHLSVGYRIRCRLPIYRKVIDPLRYLTLSEGSWPKRLVKTVLLSSGSLCRITTASRGGEIALDRYDSAGGQGHEKGASRFRNAEAWTHIAWLLDCPLVDAHAFTIRHNGRSIGIAVCYLSKDNVKPRSARIVHLSDLGDRLKLWNSALDQLEKFCRAQGAAVISLLASYPILIKVLRRQGFVSWKQGRQGFVSWKHSGLLLFVRDPAGSLDSTGVDSWHLSFAEGDEGHSGMTA